MDCKKPSELSKMTFLEIDLRRCLNKILGGSFFRVRLRYSGNGNFTPMFQAKKWVRFWKKSFLAFLARFVGSGGSQVVSTCLRIRAIFGQRGPEAWFFDFFHFLLALWVGSGPFLAV